MSQDLLLRNVLVDASAPTSWRDELDSYRSLSTGGLRPSARRAGSLWVHFHGTGLSHVFQCEVSADA